jgi:intracellular sulfur oxidation DsrE/DsrF family protein
MLKSRTAALGSIALVFALALTAAANAADAAKGPGTSNKAARHHKLVVQVSDNDAAKWNLALNNVKNVQTELGAKNVDIEIVAYGPGLGMLKMDSPAGNRVGEAIDAGVKVVACENTMENQKVTRADMLPGIGYVKAGVVELMLKQQQGYSYIRP